MTRMYNIRRNTFIAGFIIEVLFLLLAIFVKHDFIIDCLFCLMAIGVFYLMEQKHPLNPVVIVFGMMPLFLHSAGVIFGLFSLTIFGIGYDKWIHMMDSFFVAVVAFYIIIAHSRNHLARNVILAVLVMLGINVLQETTEFVGTRYLGIWNESLFSQGDGLPLDHSNDLQVFDTYWDMIFDIFGGMLAALFLGIVRSLEKRRARTYLFNQ